MPVMLRYYDDVSIIISLPRPSQGQRKNSQETALASLVRLIIRIILNKSLMVIGFH